MHSSKSQLAYYQSKIDNFLKEKLKLELHPDKSKIIPLSTGIDFIGFRNFAHFKLLRKRNIRKINNKIKLFKSGEINFHSTMASYQDWQGYAKCANSYKLREEIKRKIINIIWNKINFK